MKWLLATLNNLNRAYEFQFKHANMDGRRIETTVDDVVTHLVNKSEVIAKERAATEDGGDFSVVDDDKQQQQQQQQLALVGDSDNKNNHQLAVIHSPDSPGRNHERQTTKPSLSALLQQTIVDIAAAPSTNSSGNNGNGNSGNQSTNYKPSPADKPESIPSDRSWELCLPRILRDRACSLLAEVALTSSSSSSATAMVITTSSNSREEREVYQGAYEKRCMNSDRDILNFLGAVMAVDFRHWISGTYGDDVSKIDLCHCRGRASPVLPCQCQNEGNKNVFEPNVVQMYNRELGTGKIVRGSMAMVTRMRDAVDGAADGNPNKFWFRPQVMIRRLLPRRRDGDDDEEVSGSNNNNDGRYELADELFTGCNEDGTKELQFPATRARIKILTEIAEFYQRTGKDFYDLVVESGRRLIGEPNAAANKDSVAELNSTGLPFHELPGLLPSLCKHIPRFRDFANFTRAKQRSDSTEPPHKFTVAHQLPFKERSFLKREGSPLSAQRDRAEVNTSGKEEVTVLFLKLAQLFAVATRSCRGLFSTRALKWLRDEQPFLDEEDHLTICSDYQIPNALRFSELIVYSEELQIDITSRRMLPSQSLKEVEVRLVSVLAATYLRERLLDRLADVIAKLEQEVSGNNENNGNNEDDKKQIQFRVAFLRQARERFTTSVLDYVIWLFGRSLTSAKLGFPHHLTPGIMY